VSDAEVCKFGDAVDFSSALQIAEVALRRRPIGFFSGEGRAGTRAWGGADPGQLPGNPLLLWLKRLPGSSSSSGQAILVHLSFFPPFSLFLWFT
jgi:hypothetical protein